MHAMWIDQNKNCGIKSEPSGFNSGVEVKPVQAMRTVAHLLLRNDAWCSCRRPCNLDGPACCQSYINPGKVANSSPAEWSSRSEYHTSTGVRIVANSCFLEYLGMSNHSHSRVNHPEVPGGTGFVLASNSGPLALMNIELTRHSDSCFG